MGDVGGVLSGVVVVLDGCHDLKNRENCRVFACTHVFGCRLAGCTWRSWMEDVWGIGWAGLSGVWWLVLC